MYVCIFLFSHIKTQNKWSSKKRRGIQGITWLQLFCAMDQIVVPAPWLHPLRSWTPWIGPKCYQNTTNDSCRSCDVSKCEAFMGLTEGELKKFCRIFRDVSKPVGPHASHVNRCQRWTMKRDWKPLFWEQVDEYRWYLWLLTIVPLFNALDLIQNITFKTQEHYVLRPTSISCYLAPIWDTLQRPSLWHHSTSLHVAARSRAVKARF